MMDKPGVSGLDLQDSLEFVSLANLDDTDD